MSMARVTHRASGSEGAASPRPPPGRAPVREAYAASIRAALAAARFWAPLAAGFICLLAAAWVGPIVAWLLFIAAFGLILDGATAMFERAGSTGGLTNHRQ
jgi:hypothetical protein